MTIDYLATFNPFKGWYNISTHCRINRPQSTLQSKAHKVCSYGLYSYFNPSKVPECCIKPAPIDLKLAAKSIVELYGHFNPYTHYGILYIIYIPSMAYIVWQIKYLSKVCRFGLLRTFRDLMYKAT